MKTFITSLLAATVAASAIPNVLDNTISDAETLVNFKSLLQQHGISDFILHGNVSHAQAIDAINMFHDSAYAGLEGQLKGIAITNGTNPFVKDNSLETREIVHLGKRAAFDSVECNPDGSLHPGPQFLVDNKVRICNAVSALIGGGSPITVFYIIDKISTRIGGGGAATGAGIIGFVIGAGFNFAASEANARCNQGIDDLQNKCGDLQGGLVGEFQDDSEGATPAAQVQVKYDSNPDFSCDSAPAGDPCQTVSA